MKKVTDVQLRFIDFVLELDMLKVIKLSSMAYTQFIIIKEVGEYEESDIEMLDTITKQIFDKPNIKNMWRAWSNK